MFLFLGYINDVNRELDYNKQKVRQLETGISNERRLRIELETEISNKRRLRIEAERRFKILSDLQEDNEMLIGKYFREALFEVSLFKINYTMYSLSSETIGRLSRAID